MPIDTSMYANMRAPDIMGGIESGLKLRDLYDQRKLSQETRAKDLALKDALKQNTTIGPDGKVSVNRQGYLSQLAKGGLTNEAMAEERKFTQMDQEDMQRKFDAATKQVGTAKALIWSINDPVSYQAARQKAIELGLPNAHTLPQDYDPAIVKRMQLNTLSAEEQLAERWRQIEEERKKRDDVRKDRELAIKSKLVAAKTSKPSQPKPMNVSQAKQLGLYKSGLEAEKQWQAATSKKGWNAFDPTSSFQWIDKNDWAPNFLKSDESKEVHGAQDRWVEAFLRDASGAAIPPHERGAYAKDFFPVAGDSAQAVKDKARARQLKVEAALTAAGAAPDMPEQGSQTMPDLSNVSDDDIDRLYRELGGE